VTIIAALWLALCVAGIALSVRSALVLGSASRATQVGWIATAAYFIIAAIDAVRRMHAPFFADDVAIGVLTITFIVAGRRDEPQAEPWYLPTHAGPTGAQRRAMRERSERSA